MSATQFNSWLYHWDDLDNPGAGVKGADSTGLNGNWYKIDRAVLTEHNTNGTHKSNVIDKGNLKTTVADASTIELNASVGLRVKDDGLTGIKLASGIVDGTTLEATSGTGAKQFRIKSGGVGTAHIADDAITAAKVAHNNTVRKQTYALAFLATAIGTYARVAGATLNASFGINMPYAGSFVRATICTDAGGKLSHSVNFGTSGYTFSAGDRISAVLVNRGVYTGVRIINLETGDDWYSGFENSGDISGATSGVVLTFTVEYND